MSGGEAGYAGQGRPAAVHHLYEEEEGQHDYHYRHGDGDGRTIISSKKISRMM